MPLLYDKYIKKCTWVEKSSQKLSLGGTLKCHLYLVQEMKSSTFWSCLRYGILHFVLTSECQLNFWESEFKKKSKKYRDAQNLSTKKESLNRVGTCRKHLWSRRFQYDWKDMGKWDDCPIVILKYLSADVETKKKHCKWQKKKHC